MHICQQGIYCTCTQFAGERGARDDLRVVADFLCLLDKVVRINRDAVAASWTIVSLLIDE
jgi:hypothetical protein